MANLKELLKKAQFLNKDKKFNKVIELLTDSILKTLNSADLYAEKAQAFYRLKNYELSNEAAERALSINPKHAKGNAYKGNFYADNKEYDKAIENYNKAIEADPKYASPYNGLGTIYTELNEFYKAIEFYNKAIEADPKFALPYNGLGNTYNALKEYDKAKESFNKAIEADPKNPYPYNGLGNTYNALKEYDKAKKSYNKAIEADPKDPYPYHGLGNTYNALKEYNKAKEFYNKSIEFDPKYASPYFGLGLTYFDLKEYHKSLVAFKKYAELTKHSPDYYTSIAESRIIELRKLLENKEYSSISEIVNKIKELLLYKESRITHYTGLSVAKALVIDIDSSLFRLSEGAYLNDTSEGRELFKFLSFEFSSQKGSDTVATPFTQKPFIGSFVAEFKHDDLTLWRMYGKEKMVEAKGCSITIDTKKLLENLIDKITPEMKTGSTSKTDEEFRFYRVAYRKESKRDPFIIPGAVKKQKDLNKFMRDLSAAVTTFNSKERMDISDTQNVVELLNEIAYLFKSDAYQHEHEVRLVVKGIGFEKNIDSSFHPPRVYIELISVKPLIHQITLGPKVERPDEWAAAFNYSLDKEDYHPDILISHLPFK